VKRRARTPFAAPLFNDNLEKTGGCGEPGGDPGRLMICMKKLILLSVVLFGVATVSHAGVRVGIGIGLPLPTVGVVVRHPAPVYVASRPVYYVAPSPVYVAPPAPVYLAPPVCYTAPARVCVAQPEFILAPTPVYCGPYRYVPGFRYGPGRGYAHGYRR